MSNHLLLEKQLCFRIYTLNKLMGRLYAPALKELALTYPQYLAMLVLWQHPEGISVKSLGQQLDLDSGTLSPLLKRMEKEQLLSRERLVTDERVVMIKLAPKGKQLQTVAKDIPENMFSLTGFTPDKLVQLTTSLDELIDNLNN
ncbi:MarR family winged helix-turn-helix transcriptional regulator [Colwelliaceae bacterium MEBiC 14330]